MAHQLRHVLPEITYEMVRRTERGRFAFVPVPAMKRELTGILKDAKKLRHPLD